MSGLFEAKREAWRTHLALGLAILLVSLTVTETFAYVPRPDRVIDAVADANKSARRVRAMRYQLTLRIGDGPPVAAGELVSHPTGLARLELRAAGGLVERHILLGNQHSASRNARLLVRPRAFLPPLFVLQSNSGAVLEAALETLGVDRSMLGLAPCGDFDCYVIGDPGRVIRKPMVAKVEVVESEASSAPGADTGAGALDENRTDMPPVNAGTARLDDAEEEDEAPHFEPQADPFHASLWVDTEDHSIRQVATADGVIIKLGPYVKFEHLMVPRFWSIEEPGKRAVRFEVEGVVEVNAPAGAFSRNWLMAPLVPTGTRSDAEPESEPEASAEMEDEISSLDLEPLPPTPAVSGGPSEEDLEAIGFGTESPGEGYDYPN